MKLANQLRKILDPNLCDKKAYQRFQQRIEEGKLIRKDNKKSHFCVYFLPFNPKTQKVFIVHHKEANLWVSAGGHIEKGESISEAFAREAKEELGITLNKNQTKNPFLFTVTDIDNPPQVCRVHFDIWHLILTDGDTFKVDSQEFYESRWATLSQARKLVTDSNHLKAFSLLSS